MRRSGERVRITAQLIRAEDGFHLWSQTYDRTLEDVFAVQEDIAENIAETLNVVLNEDKRKQMNDARIKDVEAFIAYQKGIEMMARAHSTSDPVELLPEANRYFDQALAIVPTITNAQLERTDLFGHIIYNNAMGAKSYTPAELDSALERNTEADSRGRPALPPNRKRNAPISKPNAPSSTVTGQGFRPTSTGHFRPMSAYAAQLGRIIGRSVFGWAEQVSAHYERLMRCDPLSGLYAAMASQFLIWAGQSDKVIELSTHFLDDVAYQPWVDDMRFMALLASGKYHDAPGVYDPNPEGSYSTVPRKLFAYAMDNDIARARDVLETTEQRRPGQ